MVCVLRGIAVAVCLLVGALGGAGSRAGSKPPAPRTPVKSASLPRAAAFTLADAGGRQVSLADYRGRPVALLFFCGCPWCVRCAEVWGKFQRGGVFGTSTGEAEPVTLVVFSGDAAAVKDFARQAGLDPKRTVLLPDPAMRVTDAYRADPCPRAFVVDAAGSVRYTNDHADDAPRTAPALAIASRALDALRACAPAPAVSPAGKAVNRRSARSDADQGPGGKRSRTEPRPPAVRR